MRLRRSRVSRRIRKSLRFRLQKSASGRPDKTRNVEALIEQETRRKRREAAKALLWLPPGVCPRSSITDLDALERKRFPKSAVELQVNRFTKGNGRKF